MLRFCALLVVGALLVAGRAQAVSATGGVVTNFVCADGTNWTAHIFTTVGSTNLSVTAGGDVELLVVAGGGGGRGRHGLGGGGGAVIVTSVIVSSGTEYDVVVGDGGIGGYRNWEGSGQIEVPGTAGGVSRFGSIEAAGGLYGAASAGGGASGNGNPAGSSSSNPWNGGGGGGAGGPGQNATTSPSKAGNGGIGVDCSAWLSGLPYGHVGYFGGGGGGATWDSGHTQGLGGTGGGGNGKHGSPPNVGAPNTGGGGGGLGVDMIRGGKGGSGIVIVRYLTETDLPRIMNVGLADLTDTTAAIVGSLVTNGVSEATVTLYWATTDYTTNATDWVANGFSAAIGPYADGAIFTNTVSDLIANTLYYWNHNAVNASGTVWAATAGSPSFKTLGPPTVDNAGGATVIKQTSALLHGTLTNGVSAVVTVAWWQDGTTSTNLLAFATPLSEGSFSTNLTGLTSGTMYHYQCYASNAYGTAWAETATNFTTYAGNPTTGNVTWSGGAGAEKREWFFDENWAGGRAPTNPTAATVTFGTNGMAVTSVVDVDRQVGGITFGAAQNLGPMSHTVNLNGKTLTVAGSIARTAWETQTLNVTDGTLRIGTASSAGNINLGQDYGTGTLTIRPGAVLDTFNLNSITLGYTQWGPNGRGYLDLRGATVAGGVLATTNLYLRTGSSQNSRLYLDQNTEIDRIRIARNLEICRTSGPGSSYIGNPMDERLPPNISFNVGVGPSERGNITISQISFVGYGNVNGRLVASGGGTFEGWLNEMHIVRYEAGSADGSNRQSGAHIGTFDISRMNACLIDVNTLRVGTDHYVHPPLSQDNLQATMALCPGVVTANVAVVGSTIGSGWGRVSLSNTLFRVNDTFTLNRTGEVTIRLGAEPIGLDVDGTFADQSAGKIAVHFMAAPAANTTNWAIRIKGDAVATLAAMVGSSPSRLTSTGSFAGKKVGILKDATHTYYAMVDESVPFPPIAVPHATQTYELASGGTVNISTNDINNGSSDPGGRPFALSISSDGVNFSPTLSFSATGTYTVTLKITAGSDESTATCEVSIVDLHAGTASVNRTWLGAASTDLMNRREWMWSDNWVEGTPPANPTTGIIQFRDSGQSVMGLLEADRTVGGLSLGQSGITVSHTLNLGGTAPARALAVVGNVSSAGVVTLVVTNGTLRLGSDTVTNNTSITTGGGSTLRIASGATLDTYRVGTLRIGDSGSGWGSGNQHLDLRGATLAGGVLRVRDLRIQDRGSSVLLNANTTLDAIEVSGLLEIGHTSGAGTVFIGNPSDGNRLPPGIDIALGVGPSQRGQILMHRTTFTIGTATSQLIASRGGAFTAWLSQLTLVEHGATIDAGNTHAQTATLDLAAMDSCAIDVLDLRVAVDRATPHDNDNLRGTLRLPPGTMRVVAGVVGRATGVQGLAIVETSNTVVTVTDRLTLHKTAQVTHRVGAESAGLIIENADAGALSIHAAATLTIRFTESPLAQPHYGLRWKGNHLATLEGWRHVSDGRLVIDSSGLPKPAEIYLYQGTTHIGIPPPAGSIFLLR